MHALLLEDDIDLGQALVDHLEAHGHAVHWVKLIAQALVALQERPELDLVLLDRRVPDGDGLEVLRQMRARGDQRPTLVLSARDQISDRIEGLRLGADDYLIKPFDLDEMSARIEAVRRRLRSSASPEWLSLGDVMIDFKARSVRQHERDIPLTAMEWALLATLAKRPGHSFSRADLEAALYDTRGSEPESNSLEVLVSRLRRKLGAHLISTQRGWGYRLEQA